MPDISPPPMLSYHRQQPAEELAWILRWVGAWIIVHGAASAISRALLYLISGYRIELLFFSLASPMLGGAAFAAVGAGVFHRRRWALKCVIALLWISLPLALVAGTGLGLGLGLGVGVGAGIAGLTQRLLHPFVQLLLMAALVERADEHEMLLPPRLSGRAAPPGRDQVAFFKRLLAIYWMSYLPAAGVQFAVLILSPQPALAGGGLYAVYLLVRGLLLGLCGVALWWRRRDALLGIIAIQVAGCVTSPLLSSLMAGRPIEWRGLSYSLPLVLASSVLLWVLYRRLGQPRASGIVASAEVPLA